MKLYYAPGACSLAVNIVARETGQAVELVKVDVQNKKTANGDDFRKINAKGYVPALVLDNGETLTEVAVICQFLADQKPDLALAPEPGSMARYRLMEALNFIATEIHKQISALFNPALTSEMQEVQKATIAWRFDALEKMLDGQPYLTGEHYTVADAYLFTVLNWTTMLDIDTARWPNIQAFSARIAQRPKVLEALKAEGLIE